MTAAAAAHRPGTDVVRVLLSDGTSGVLRTLGPADRDEVERLHRALPRDDLYLRFFGFSDGASHAVADAIVGADSVAVGLFCTGVLVGVGNFSGAEPPEIAFAVAHGAQHHGIGTLLLKVLVQRARELGVRQLVAEVLAINLPMLRVFAESGLPVTRRAEGSTVELTLDVARTVHCGQVG
jgi:GNAT superfamily N-acetyltransferase